MKLIVKYFIFFLLVVGFTTSCQVESTIDPNNNKFFDIERFIDTLMTQESPIHNVKRTIILDDKKEEKELVQYDMTEAYIYLKKFNINQPRLYDKYTVETDNETTTYTALEPELNVQKCIIEREGDKVQRVFIDYKVGTMISASRKEIDFMPGTKLSVDSENTSKFNKDGKMTVIWDFMSD